MWGEYGVRTLASEWIEFRVSEERARKVYERDPRGRELCFVARDLKVTVIASPAVALAA